MDLVFINFGRIGLYFIKAKNIGFDSIEEALQCAFLGHLGNSVDVPTVQLDGIFLKVRVCKVSFFKDGVRYVLKL